VALAFRTSSTTPSPLQLKISAKGFLLISVISAQRGGGGITERRSSLLTKRAFSGSSHYFLLGQDSPPCRVMPLPPILGSCSCLYNTNSAEARTSTLHHHHRAPASSKLLTPSPLQAVSPSISTRRCAIQLVREISALFCPSLCCSLVLCSSGRPQLPKRRVESNSLFRGFDSPLALFWVPSLFAADGRLAALRSAVSLYLSRSRTSSTSAATRTAARARRWRPAGRAPGARTARSWAPSCAARPGPGTPSSTRTPATSTASPRRWRRTRRRRSRVRACGLAGSCLRCLFSCRRLLASYSSAVLSAVDCD
jgi:hypothetical protein